MIWIVALLALMWIVWRERNRITFEGVEMYSVQKRSSLLSFFFSFWGSLEVPLSINDWVMFVENHLFLQIFYFFAVRLYTSVFMPNDNELYYCIKKLALNIVPINSPFSVLSIGGCDSSFNKARSSAVSMSRYFLQYTCVQAFLCQMSINFITVSKNWHKIQSQ